MNAQEARKAADSLAEQMDALEKQIQTSTQFLNDSFHGSLSVAFVDGPFKGKTWCDIYKETESAKKARYSLRNPLREAEFNATCLEAIEANGKCYLSIAGRDCDCSSFGYATSFDSLEEAISYRDMMYESADGPIGISAITKEDFDAVEPYSHDLALAAHEDGHPYSVSEADRYRRI